MKLLGYILAYSLVWLLHLMPEPLLYLFSDFMYFITYRVVGYRKKVVLDNLTKAFPNYESPEIRKIAKRFYHHLCDVILETAVSHFQKESTVLKKITFRNLELLDELYAKKKQVMAVSAHYGNWEYLTTLGLVSEYPHIAIYKILKNSYIDRMVKRKRKRLGAIPVPMEKITRKLISFHQEKRPVMTLFLSDQRPMFHNIQYWTKFLGMDTPLFLGTEKLARKLDAAVVFVKTRKVKRGKYELEIVPICEDPSGLKPYEITEKHVRILEKLIREAPEFWLWSHRRWKHSIEKYRQKHGCHQKAAGDSKSFD